MKSNLERKPKKILHKFGNAQYRIVVFRSLKHIYAQVIEIKTGKTIFSESDLKIKTKTAKTHDALEVGKELGKKIIKAKLSKLAFDRNGYKFHGRVKALVEALRKEGVKI